MANSGFKVQFTRHQIDHDHEIVQGAIASRLGLGRLDQAVDTFQQAVRHPRLKPAQDAVQVPPKRCLLSTIAAAAEGMGLERG